MAKKAAKKVAKKPAAKPKKASAARGGKGAGTARKPIKANSAKVSKPQVKSVSNSARPRPGRVTAPMPVAPTPPAAAAAPRTTPPPPPRPKRELEELPPAVMPTPTASFTF
jgi:hypothetical protein